MKVSDLYISVIIATYNMPEWLNKVLHGYNHQTYPFFEIIIADDGSDERTKKVIESFKEIANVPVSHLWHEDKGYRRQEILNRSILASKYDYILFTDGDCIPRADFLEVHAKYAEKGRFLSGGYCKLPMITSRSLSVQDIESQKCFKADWLKKIGPLGGSQTRKLNASENWGKFLDFVTPAGATFNNCNTSAWKADLLMVKGYDERMQYGGADREIGERLENNNIRGKQIRHQAICIHLDHSRGYKTDASIEKNREIRKKTRKEKIRKTSYGIKENQD